MSDCRKAAIDAVCKLKGTEGTIDYTVKDIKEVYCEHVFSQAIQRERLPKAVFKSLQKTIQAGEEINPEIADAVALAMRDWAIEHGATHFTHWFQPMTGATAEKHDSFITPTGDGEILAQFTGKELVRGEPDASSFPSGGLRATFEARGYTAWDPSSPAFILDNPNGATLVIPTMFISWTGEALDKKTPLLRSMQAVNKSALRMLRLFGNTTASRVTCTVGAEQEYFLVDKHFAMNRPDLVNTGRTLYGAKPPKGQELDDHYFGAINERVLAYMAEVEYELLRLGVPIKTRHNEVAPGQFELAPTFESANLATDHQMLVMETLRKVAGRHGFVCLLHEKPFAGINGSGKHNNWSISTDEGENLLEPGETPSKNVQFIAVCSAICRAIYKYAPLLRLTAASAGNDHRLGANEAPPAIISIFLGKQLSDVLDRIEAGLAPEDPAVEPITLGISMLPKLPRDAGDRNRTSPFAFTGNKFEFRAVGSTMNPAAANTVLNTIVAESLDFMSEKIEKLMAEGKDINEAVQTILPDMIKEFKPVLFDGDGYSADWHAEAEKRGLPNLKTTVDVLPEAIKPYSVELFEKYGVYNERELHSRYEILLENYATTLSIEAETATVMAKTLILPAAIKQQTLMANSIAALKAAGVESPAQTAALKALTADIDALVAGIAKLDEVMDGIDESDALATATYMRDKVFATMGEVREVADKIENVVDDEIWPLPTYREMLFIR